MAAARSGGDRESDPHDRRHWCLVALEAFSALAATETYGLWVTLDPLRASERSLRCVWQAMGHAERLRRLVTMGVWCSSACRSSAAARAQASGTTSRTLRARLPAPVRTLPPSCLACPGAAMHGASPVPRCLVFRRRLMRHADTLGPVSSSSATSSVGRRQV